MNPTTPYIDTQYSNSVVNYVQGNQYNYEYNDRENGPGHAFPVRTKLLQRLRPSGFPVYNPSARLPETCVWTLDHELVGSWLDPQSYSTNRLWIYGGPGTGKSVLAAYLIDHVKETVGFSEDEIVLSFLCKARGSSKQKVAHVIMGLIREFLSRPDRPYEKLVADELEAMLLSERKDHEFTADQLTPHLVSFLMPFKRTWVIVDALDECDDALILINILHKLTSTFGIKIMLLGRNEKAIAYRLRNWTGVEVGGEGTTEGDMRMFVAKEVKSLVSDFPLLRPQSDELERGLFDAAGDMFLYVRLKCETIRDLNPSTKSVVKETLATLNSSPHSLEQVYEKYLSQRLERNMGRQNEVAVRTLQWIMYSPRPVTSTLLTSALVIDIDDDRGVCGDDLDHDIVRTVDKALGILIEWREMDSGVLHAQLVHLSFRDYLLHMQQLPFGQSPPHSPYDCIHADASHNALMRTCRIALDAQPVVDAMRQFYDSTDERWQVHPQRQGRLRKQLYTETQWLHWEHKQLKDLDRERDWLDEEAQRTETDIAELGEDLGQGWLQSGKERLELLVKARGMQGDHLQRLRMVTNLRERELMIYAFGEFTYHLAQVESPLPTITTSISTLGKQINTTTIGILAEINSDRTDRTSIRANYADALGLLADTVTLIDTLSRANQESLYWRWYWVFLCGVFRFNLWRCIYSVRTTRPDKIWSDNVLQTFDASSLPTVMQHLFALVTQALENLREVETVICNFDEEVQVVVGTGFLVHITRRYSQVLAASTILKIFGDTERGKQLLSEDDFQYPRLLANSTKWTPENVGPLPGARRLSVSFKQKVFLGCLIAACLSLYCHPFRSSFIFGLVIYWVF